MLLDIFLRLSRDWDLLFSLLLSSRDRNNKQLKHVSLCLFWLLLTFSFSFTSIYRPNDLAVNPAVAFPMQAQIGPETHKQQRRRETHHGQAEVNKYKKKNSILTSVDICFILIQEASRKEGRQAGKLCMSSLHQLLLPLLAVFHIYIITSIEINSGRSLFYCSLWVSFSILPNSLFGVCVLQLVATRCWWIDAVRCKDHFPALQTFIRHLSFSYYGPCSNKEGRTFASYARLLLLTITTRQRRLFPIGTALRKVFFLPFFPSFCFLSPAASRSSLLWRLPSFLFYFMDIGYPFLFYLTSTTTGGSSSGVAPIP